MAVRDVVQAAAGVGGGGEYVEDVFSTYLYMGNGSTQNVPNGIDLDGEGGMVWVKTRSTTGNNFLFDTLRGVTAEIRSNSTNAQSTGTNNLTAFNSDGFSIGSAINNTNNNGVTYASWTFRKAPKFFDIVTYTGTGTLQTINHNLGSVPGCIIVKKTSGASNWAVYHTGIGNTKTLTLNSPAATTTIAYWGDTDPTTTQFTVGGQQAVGDLGGTYVAYLFAHDAGGFGDDGEQNIISCGSYTGNGSSNGPEINLGWEPQWIMVKDTSQYNDPYSGWIMLDTMRGLVSTNGSQNIYDPFLWAQNANAEERTGEYISPTATGFKLTKNAIPINTNGSNYIYIAIRRGPMKTPESGTEVFVSGYATGGYILPGSQYFDLGIKKDALTTSDWLWVDRVRGLGESGIANATLDSASTDLETATTNRIYQWSSTAESFSNGTITFGTDTNNVGYAFKRAPSFMDVVAYTGNGTAGRTVSHNLGVAPEMIIVKNRAVNGYGWAVYTASVGNTAMLQLNETSAPNTNIVWWNNTSPTSSVFTVGNNQFVNESANRYIAYLFASCPGVSKVGSYTGTGANLDVDCGFSAGARFVLIKRRDSTGDWYIWNYNRGIVSGNDPYLRLNSRAPEVTSTDYIDPLASGFTVTSSAPAALNASGGSYIFLAIA